MKDRRLIEDYLPIETISEEAVSEKSVRLGHISTLHLWWARRPLVASRAAVYATLVSASRFVPENGPDNKKQSLGRANAAKFIEQLCRYPGDQRTFAEARKHILEAHAARQSESASNDERPKVLDLFSGGGAIPLEMLRLGANTYAIELNPVAYLINLCTLVYPQKYGKPEITTKGTAREKTWAGLVDEVRAWGNWILAKVQTEIGDLYPFANDSEFKGKSGKGSPNLFGSDVEALIPAGHLLPVAYLWTRTVRCKKPDCRGEVPLARHTWLCRKEKKSGGRYIAVKATWSRSEKRLNYSVVQASSEAKLGFDPSEGSRGGSTVCPGCHSPIDNEYVKAEGCAKRFGYQLMAIVCNPSTGTGRRYLNPNSEWETRFSAVALLSRADAIAEKLGISVPDEPLEANPRSFDVQHFGFTHWRDVFTPRQLVAMVAFTGTVKAAHAEMLRQGYAADRAKAVSACLSMVLGRLSNQCTSLCRWQPEFVAGMLGDAGLPMIMDFAEINPLADSSGGWPSAVKYVCAALENFAMVSEPATIVRGSALATPWENETFDAIVTDPPYYDSRSYSNLSDHFYVWHKRAVGHLYAEHFASQLTPKKTEAIAAPYRHDGNRAKADAAYEGMMQKAFEEARRLLKPGAPMVCVYAHKTTSGWVTIINAMRIAGLSVVEAWPIEMERKVRQNALETAALASSIFLVARRREEVRTGLYETEVRSDLDKIVRERVQTLWSQSPDVPGIQGGDLVIACIGAGLRAFTRFARVEFTNGEEVPAERFLAEVEAVVLDSILARLSKDIGANEGKYRLEGVDPATRFYILWRYTYRWTELDAGEVIVFANGTHVELEGLGSLTYGARALLEKKKSKYRLRDFTDRGDEEKLGMPNEDGAPAPLIDALHRTLWLMENRPRELPEFLRESGVNREQMRLVAQALAGPALKGGEMGDISPTGELSALARLTANWRSVVEDAAMTTGEREAKRKGQTTFDLDNRG
jgi:putative DNA methylase